MSSVGKCVSNVSHKIVGGYTFSLAEDLIFCKQIFLPRLERASPSASLQPNLSFKGTRYYGTLLTLSQFCFILY